MAKQRRKNNNFDPKSLLTGRGPGQSRVAFAPNQVIYRQGDVGDAAFYIESGWIKISSVSPSGKEAVIAIRGEGEFFGTRCLVARRTGTTTTLTACSAIRITVSALTRLLREDPDFAVMFAKILVCQSIHDQENSGRPLDQSGGKASGAGFAATC